MTEIFLIRHTQAEGNLYRMMQGHWDGGVTIHGHAQIAALAERFRNERVDAVYSSDLTRARLTAGAITKYHDLPLHTDEALREIDVGPWEAEFFGNVLHNEPEQAMNFVQHQDIWHIDGAESFEAVRERGYAALVRIAQANEGGRVAVVSHGVTIRCIMTRVLNVPLDDVQTLPIFGNTSVTTLVWDGAGFSAVGMNDTAHLDVFSRPLWPKVSALRDEAIDPCAEGEYYKACYADSWRAAHGTLRGYDEAVYLAAAKRHHAAHAGAVRRLYDGDVPVGLIDMDTARDAEKGLGWISLVYLCQEYRGRGYGIQVLARAIKEYSLLSRHELRLHVAEDNAAARRFYEGAGFEYIDEPGAAAGQPLLMRLPLGGNAHV